MRTKREIKVKREQRKDLKNRERKARKWGKENWNIERKLSRARRIG